MTDLHPEHLVLAALIAARIAGHERSLQTAIGPSELGTPCARRLGHKLAGTPRVNDLDDVPWRPTVGTAVHEWLAAMLRAANKKGDPRNPRWLVEHRTTVGTIAGTPVKGTVDAYDIETGRVIDWKVVGPTTLREQRYACRDGGPGPGAAYAGQVQLYGRGLARAEGYDVREVCVYFLPSNGELKDGVFWSTPYDQAVGGRVMARARDIAALLAERGPQRVLGRLKTANDHCGHCPWFSPGSDDLATGCPGDASLQARTGDQFEDLLT